MGKNRCTAPRRGRDSKREWKVAEHEHHENPVRGHVRWSFPSVCSHSVRDASYAASPLDIPLVAMFKLFRIETVDEMLQFVFPDKDEQESELVEFVRRALSDPAASHSKGEILEWLIAEEAPVAAKEAP